MKAMINQRLALLGTIPALLSIKRVNPQVGAYGRKAL